MRAERYRSQPLANPLHGTISMRHILLLAGLLFSGLHFPAHADDDEISQRQVTLLAASCANCHGTDGRGTSTLAPIAGRPATVLQAQMLAFKHNENSGATVMDRIAQGYSDTEIEALAEYFSQQQVDN